MSGEVGKPVKVAICIPAGDEVKTFFAYDLARMMVFTETFGIQMQLLIANGSLVMKQRQTLANAVLKDGTATHILWLDSDLRFPKDLIVRLLSHDVECVCGSYTERAAPYRPLAFTNALNWNERVFVGPEDHGLKKIIACGFGCVLMRIEVLHKMEKPYFMVGYNRDLEAFIGEDIYFFLNMNGLGIPLNLDQDLTRELAHIGRFEYTTEHADKARQQREAAEAAKGA